MPTANRRRWMREYMKEYRQGKLRGEGVKGHHQVANSAKVEKLRKTQRLQSFKWRIARLLSSQYEILMCAQGRPHFGNFRDADGSIKIRGKELCSDIKEVLADYELLEDFKDIFNMGGGELCKALLLRKYSKKFDQAIPCLIVALDKAVLLEYLQQLPDHGGERWELVFHRVRSEAKKGDWRPIDFSAESNRWWEEHRSVCELLKCIPRDRPQWDSSGLHALLSEWAMGIRKIGHWDEHEAPGASDVVWREMISPIWPKPNTSAMSRQ
jgi:hypothetical protein